jgi:WD40 repeat protein
MTVRSVAFSHDSTQLAFASNDGMVKVWDARSGECLQTVYVGQILHRIWFDLNINYLHTDIGIIDISAPSISTPALITVEPQTTQYQGVAIGAGGTRITCNSKNLLRLPSEYRPSCLAVLGGILAIGVGNGRVWICEIQSSAF